MADIRDPRLLYLKGVLFLVMGLLAACIVLLLHPDWRIAALLGLMVWAFCRAYYFAFYVVQHYIDPRYRYAGLGSFLRHAMSAEGPLRDRDGLDRFDHRDRRAANDNADRN